MTSSTEYYIWSHRHNRWWRANRAGYTARLSEAGRYSKEEAADIIFGCMPGANVVADVGLAGRHLSGTAQEVTTELSILRQI